MNPTSANIESKLHQWQMASVSGDEVRARSLYNEIYRVVFAQGREADLWDERVLMGLKVLLQAHPPAPEVYGEQAEALLERAKRVHIINDAFYRLLDPDTSSDEAIESLAACAMLPDHIKQRLHSDANLADLRRASSAPSVRLEALVDQLAQEWHEQPVDALVDLHRCIEAIKDREGLGTANALLVHKQTNKGIVLSVAAGVQRGSGQVRNVTAAAATFVTAVERARLALVDKRFLTESQDVLLTVNLTEAEYSGGSIALGAAIAIYGAASNRHVDPYTAFTGDINFKDGRWVVQGVEGIERKLEAALEAGCRRVFLPRDNEPDVPREVQEHLKIVTVGDLAEVLKHLLLPMDATRADSPGARKVHLLRSLCMEQGWQLSKPNPIQDGLQFTISPPNGQDMKVNIYGTGAHSPKRSERPEFQKLLDALNSLDAPSVPLRSVQEVFTIKDADVRAQIREGLEKIPPVETRDEPYCEYSFRFEEGQERLVVKQYTSGKLQVQGNAGPLYRRVLEVIIPTYNLRYPNAALNVEDYLPLPSSAPGGHKETEPATTEVPIAFPYVGTDESGKGDYFGPMVVAAVWLDEPTQKKLEGLGVRDSKLLSDQKCRDLAAKIRDLCQGKYEEVEIPPERYNTLYEQFQREKKNLNHLLAWGHARALETLLARHGSQHAVADQFGDETYIQSKLMEKGKTLQLVQTPKAERYTAVAAASILARDRFLQRLGQLGRPFGVSLLKGASPAVVDMARVILTRGGKDALRKVAKMHFKTTSLVLKQEEARR